MRKLFALPILIFLTHCVGSDEVDPEEVSEEITISATKTSLAIGETLELSSEYHNQFGEQAEIVLDWHSSNESAATVDNGVVTAVAKGQTSITASVDGAHDSLITSNEILLTIVADPNDLTSVTVYGEKTNLQVDETLQLTYTALDGNGGAYTGTTMEWRSTNENTLSVDQQGLITAVAEGGASIILTIDEVASTPYMITVGSHVLMGMFQDLDYDASGTATMYVNDSDELILEFGSDFETEFLLGTWVYLSNSLQGSQVKSNGLAVANISQSISGEQSFNISDISAETGLSDYKYVVILCEPAGISMGYAELK